MWWLTLALAGEWGAQSSESFRVLAPADLRDQAVRTLGVLEAGRLRLDQGFGAVPRNPIPVVLEPGRGPGVRSAAGARPMWFEAGDAGPDTVVELLEADLRSAVMARPPRAFQDRVLFEVFDVAPVPSKAPNWIVPAYASWGVSTIHHHGELHDDRELVWLRALALEAALPDYRDLGEPTWHGSDTVLGAAFVRWLEQQQPGGLEATWTRLTARYPRTFNEAFQGVFGEPWWVMYDRFCVELTAVAHDTRGPRSPLWMHTLGRVSTPTVSPNGELLAFVHQQPNQDAVLKVFEVAPDTEQIARRDAKIATILERDPLDARAVAPRAPPHRLLRSVTDRTRMPTSPRWLDDNSLLFLGIAVTPDGRVQRDLYRWDHPGGVHRVTRGADLVAVDSRGGRIVGVQRDGLSTRVVEISPEGAVSPVLERAVRAVRLGPEGRRLAWVPAESPDRVELTHPEQVIRLPSDWQVEALTWDAERGLIASVGTGGRLDLVRLSDRARLTGSGLASAPEASVAGLFHLGLTSKGQRIHRLEAFEPVPEVPPVPLPAGRDPAIAPMPAVAVEVEEAPGAGPWAPNLLVGGRFASALNIEAGLRLGDLAGRNELAIQGGVGNVLGIGAWWTHRGARVEPVVRAWMVQEPDGLRGGGSVFAALGHHGTGVLVDGRVGAFADNLGSAGFLAASVDWIEPRMRRIALGVQGRGLAGWLGEGTVMGMVDARLRFGNPEVIALEAEGGIARTRGALFQLGGVATSLVAPEAQWIRVQPGWILADRGEVEAHDRVRVQLRRERFAVLAERRRFGLSDPNADTLVGFELGRTFARDPRRRLPRVRTVSGLGCVVENDGVIDQPCRSAADYRFWAELVFVPR